MNPDLRAIEAALLGEPHEPSNLSPEAASVVLPLVRRVVRERDELREALEEARLTLAAEQGRAEGAPSGWRNDIGHEWIRDWPPTETRYGTILWASVRGDPVDGYVLMGKIKAGDVQAYADLPGFGTAPDGKELWLFSTARAAMLAADNALFESRRAHCLAKARQLQSDGVILYPPSGTHQQTPAIMIDRLSDPDLSEAVLAIYEKVLFP